MPHEIDEYYHMIGRKVLDLASPNFDKVVVYAEVEDGMSECAIFVQLDGVIIYKDCDIELHSIIVDFWEAWRTISGNREWRVIEYSLKDGQFDLEFTYSDEVDPDEGAPDRRPRSIIKHFGRADVIYPNS